MKKLFTLALALLIASVGFSQVQKVSRNDAKIKQNVAKMQQAPRLDAVNEFTENHPTMTSTREEGDLDYTYYDWQSNHGARNWTITWPDGKVNFAYTYASTDNYSDRGTAIGTYDSNTDEWIPMGGRVEKEKTGFGSIARYGQNGIVIAAHTSDNLGVYLATDKDNLAPSCATNILYTNNGSYTHPAVMTSGANRDIIHVFCGNFDDSSIPFKYWRSTDGETWDKAEVILPYVEEYGAQWSTNEYYWMETTEDNCLALVINSTWCDGMVLYSYDDGETWERKVFYHHPGVNATFDSWFMYPRWTSAVWGPNHELRLGYEFNGSTDAANGEGGYYPAIGGVCFWSESMPYAGDGSSFADWGVDPNNPLPPTPGQPFIMDSAYIYEDIYASLWWWSDANHDMFPECIGYLSPLTDDGEWESPYVATEWILTSDDFGSHGKYNCGNTGMPALAAVPGTNTLVMIWISMDENNTDDISNEFYFKLFGAYSNDGGLTWSDPVHISKDFMHAYSEFAYPQLAIVNDMAVIAVMEDGETGTFVQGDDNDGGNNFYHGFATPLTELFPGIDAVEETISHNVQMSIFPNPAVDQLNVTLNQSADIVIYNIMGQSVMNVNGHVGANSINISNLTSGIYFVNAGSDVQKFIVK